MSIKRRDYLQQSHSLTTFLLLYFKGRHFVVALAMEQAVEEVGA